MSVNDQQNEELLPMELKLRLLHSELERLNTDLRWIQGRKHQIESELHSCEELLSQARRQRKLRLVR